MTDEQARRIAELKARRSAGGRSTAARGYVPVDSRRQVSQPRPRKHHPARASRQFALGLSVVAAAGMVSGMWSQAAKAITGDPAATPTDPAATAAAGQPQQTVYIVVHRPGGSSGADSLRSTSSSSNPTTVPAPATVAPAPTSVQQVTPAPAPLTRSHGSR
jgi:hypothetical protein